MSVLKQRPLLWEMLTWEEIGFLHRGFTKSSDLIGLRADVAPTDELVVPEAVVLVELLHALTISAATATNAPIEYRNGLLRRMGALPS